MAQQLDVRYVNFYTAGSSALKIAPAIPQETVTLPKKIKRKRLTLYIDPVAIAGILVAATMMILMTVGVVELATLRQDEVVMASYVDVLQTENESLREEYEAGYDPQEIEKTALALGMIPAEQAQRLSIRVEEPVKESKSAFRNFFTFLTGLFA